jgi:3',5'-cyclic-AMP phosphodiesterase
MLRIAHISDLHIPATTRLNTQDPACRNFLHSLTAVLHGHADVVVLSGDLAADKGEIESYQWLAQVLATHSGVEYIIMAGNHDNVANMRIPLALAQTDIKQGLLYFSRTYAGRTLIFLDSAAYQLEQTQLDWLEAECAGKDEVLLFIHHPPVYCGCAFMDYHHSLRNISEVWPRLCRIDAIKHIFCGHYHTSRSLMLNGRTLHLTPSSKMEIDSIQTTFHISHTRPGWRWIEWGCQGVHTWVEYGT